MSDGVLTFKAFNCDISKVISSRGLDTGGKVQQYIDSEVLRLNEPFVPKDTGSLFNRELKIPKLVQEKLNIIRHMLADGIICQHTFRKPHKGEITGLKDSNNNIKIKFCKVQKG